MTKSHDWSFKLVPLTDTPALSLAPQSSRMVSAYEDRVGRCHVISDVLDHDRQTPFGVLDSWDARLEYWISSDYQKFQRAAVVAERGIWTGDPATSDTDCVGVASPGVLVTSERLWVYYASRGPRCPMGPFQLRGEMGPDALDTLPGRIETVSAPLDSDGSPSGPFSKDGIMVDLAQSAESMRLDDPCAVLHDGQIWMFFKSVGYPNQAGDRDVTVMLATAPEHSPAGPFTVNPTPVLHVDGGGEMPRVFHHGSHWHMFYRRFKPTAMFWEHYIAEDPTHWRLVSDTLFNCAGPGPARSVTDICPVWRPFGSGPPRLCFAAGVDDGTYGDPGKIKQWLYEMHPYNK